MPTLAFYDSAKAPKRTSLRVTEVCINHALRQMEGKEQDKASAAIAVDTFAVEMAMVKHLLRLTSYKEYSASLKPMLKTPAIKRLRNAMLSDFTTAVNLKNALLAVLRDRLTDKKAIKARFKAFELEDHSELIDGLRDHRMYTKGVKKAKSVKVRLNSSAEVERFCAKIMVAVKDYTAKFAHKKLTFIAKSNNLKIDDLMTDLKVKAIRAFYEVTPFISEDHTLNSVKRAIHNEGINKIKYYTADRRRRLNNDGNGQFSNTEVSFDAVSRGTDSDMDMENLLMSQVMVKDHTIRNLEIKMSLDNLRSLHKKRKKNVTALNLLAMTDNPMFVKYAAVLYPGKVKRTHSTEDVFDSLGRKRFLRTIRKFVKRPKKPFYGFIESLRGAL